MNPGVAEIIDEGLRDGLRAYVSHLFQNMATAGESNVEERLRSGIERSIIVYDRACKIVKACTQDSMGD